MNKIFVLFDEQRWRFQKSLVSTNSKIVGEFHVRSRAEPRIRLNVVCIPGCAEHGNDGPIEEYHGYKMPFTRDFIHN